MVKCESVGFKKQTINILMNVKPPKCEAGCLFKYKYGNSDCNLENKGTYLKIYNRSSSDNINFPDMGNITVNEVRLYSNGKTMIKGSKFSSELIIQHKGPLSSLYVCIPIQKVQDNLASRSSYWFREFMTFIPVQSNKKVTVNVGSEFSMNKIIPESEYYVCDGTFDWNGMGTCNDKILVFTKPIYMRNSDWNNLNKKIKKDNTKPYLKSETFKYNKIGTSVINSVYNAKSDIPLTCSLVEVDEEGNEISDKNNNFSKSNIPEAPDKPEIDLLKLLGPLLIILGIILSYGLYKLISYVGHNITRKTPVSPSVS
tara:strand:- start:1506 stop:2444 length:939 start_codon:yes stop_codon:yes gene_type:complete